MEHKELARFKEIFARFESLLNQVDETYSPLVLSRIEKDGMVAMRELQFCAPRLWNDFSNVTRARRNAIAKGLVAPSKPTPETEHFIAEATPEEAKALDKAVEEFEKNSTKSKKTSKKGKK